MSFVKHCRSAMHWQHYTVGRFLIPLQDSKIFIQNKNNMKQRWDSFLHFATMHYFVHVKMLPCSCYVINYEKI